MDFAKLQERLKQKKQDLKQREKTLKPAPGTNRYVLLPGWRVEDRETLYHEFGQHYIKNPAGDILAVYPCADKTYNRPCDVCNSIAAAMRTVRDDESKKVLTEASSRGVFLLNVLALDTETPAEPQILEVSKSVFTALLDAVGEWGSALFDPETPQIITITRDGKGLNTKYAVQVSPKKVKMPANTMDKLKNLDDYVKQEGESQLQKALGAINSVAGLLGAPTRSAAPAIGRDTPRTTSSLDDVDLTSASTIEAEDMDFEDLSADFA